MRNLAQSRFELFVAARYLRARRKEAVISVITVISVVGVTAGVMALVIAMAVTNGFRNTLEHNLLGAMAHIEIEEKGSNDGIYGWREMCDRLRKMPHVTAVSPSLYDGVMLQGGVRAKMAVLKGVDIDLEMKVSDALRHLKEGSVDALRDPDARPPAVIVGNQLKDDAGLMLKAVALVLSQGQLTPYGPEVSAHKFRVAGVFSTDFYEIDDLWAYTSIPAVQRVLGLDDVVNQIELKVDDLNRAPEYAAVIGKAVGPHYQVTSWQERNGPLLNSMRMERVMTTIVISLIILVAALNILIVLVMMVMEKYKDIAILMSMGARRDQIRRIFMLQGVLIGVVGSAIGLTLGYTLSYLANKYQWIPLEKSVYAFSFVPFNAQWTDGVWIAAMAIVVSFLATIYPSRNATRISPVEVMRYE